MAIGIILRESSEICTTTEIILFKDETLLDCNVWSLLHWRGCRILFRPLFQHPFYSSQTLTVSALWNDLNRKLLLNSDTCALFPCLLYCICSPTRKRRVNAHDRSLTHSFIHPEQSEPQFLNVRHKSPPPKLNLVYGACVPESYTLLPPPRLAAYQRTGNSSRGRHACHGCFLLTRFRSQPAGSPTHIQTLTRPARRNTRTSAGAWLMYAHAKTN